MINKIIIGVAIFGVLAIILPLGYLFSSFIGPIDLDSNKSKVENIEKMFSQIESKKITYYHYQSDPTSGCKTLEYQRGKYMENPVDNHNCYGQYTSFNYSTTSWQDAEASQKKSYSSFDEQANKDFMEISSSFDWQNIRTFNAVIENDMITSAEFSIKCNFCRTSYTYSPNFKNLPDNIKNEMWYEKIDNNWYRKDQDWN